MRELALVAGFIFCATSVCAQQPAATPPEVNAAAIGTELRKAIVGDHWTYDVTDQITGRVTATRTVSVTELTKDEITTRVEFAGKENYGSIIYDHFWNIRSDSVWRYSPNDGSGIQLPLTAGKEWKISADSVNSSNGAVWKRVGTSRVMGSERVTTKAGTFDAFTIETNFVARNTKDPTRSSDFKVRTWFSLDANHWIKRNTTVRLNGHLVQDEMIELTEFAQK